MTVDPPRLLEDISANAALRGDLTEASLATVEGLDLSAGLASLTAATATTSTTVTSTGLSLLAKVGIGAVITAGAIGLWVGMSGPSGSAASAPALVTQGPAPVAATPNASGRTNPAVLIEGVEIPPTPVTKPEPAAAPEEPAELPTADAVEATPVEIEPAEARKAAKRSHRSAKSASAGAPAADDAVLREAKKIAAARASLESNPGKSLRLVHEAEKEFSDGQLIEERRAIEILALVRLGRRDQAQQRADAFLTKYGRGAHAAAVRRALAAD
ncbi:MAG: hypothetical protein AAF799_41510 [Myxococcota bacterium]